MRQRVRSCGMSRRTDPARSRNLGPGVSRWRPKIARRQLLRAAKDATMQRFGTADAEARVPRAGAQLHRALAPAKTMRHDLAVARQENLAPCGRASTSGWIWKVGCAVAKGAADFILDAQRALLENPAPAMLIPSWQSPVAIVARLDRHGRRRRCDGVQFDTRPACDPESGPYLGGILSVDDDGVVGGGAALSLPLRIRAVLRSPGIDEHAPAPEAQLETQGIRVCVSRQIVRADRCAIAHEVGGRGVRART
jgi:hypothetical protein